MGNKASIEECFCDFLIKQGVKLVVFDMDLTMTTKHSRGGVTSLELDSFVSSVTPMTKLLIPMALKKGLAVGVATMSDEYLTFQDQNLIAGKQLVRELLKSFLNSKQVEKIQIVSMYPDIYIAHSYLEDFYKAKFAPVKLAFPPQSCKTEHLNYFRQTTMLKPSEIILLDDDRKNVFKAQNEGYRALPVEKGLTSIDLKRYFI